MWEFVAETGDRLDRPRDEVEPYIQILSDNWFDSPASLVDTKPEELASLGIPLRFAKELVNSATSARAYSRDSGGKGRRKGKGKAKGKESEAEKGGRWKDSREEKGEYKQSLDLWDCEPAYNLRGALIGEGGRNMHHIQDQSGASVWVVGEAGDTMHLEVKARSRRELSHGAKMAKDLINTVYSNYERWLEKEGKSGGWESKGGSGKRGRHEESGKGRNRGDKKFQRVLHLDECDPAFHIRSKFIGAQGDNVHHIQDQTGAKLWLMGGSGEPTRLEITASNSEALEKATQMSEDLIGSVMEEYEEWRREEGREGQGRRKEKGKSKGKADMTFTESLDLWDADPEFNIKGKLIGEKGRKIFHIQDKTGAKLWLFGGENGDPLRLEVNATCDEDLKAALDMAQDLTRSVYDDYERWLEEQEGGGRNGPGSSKDGGKGRNRGSDKFPRARQGKGRGSDGEYTKSLKLKACDPAFRIKGALIGDGGRNVHHIKDQSRARLWIKGDEDEGLRVDISADSVEDLNKAVQMTKDLIKTVYDDYDNWLRDRGEGSNGRDKGSYRERSRSQDRRHDSNDDDEPPVKRSRYD